MISIILIEPETEGNIGAVARAMKNFGFNNLVLVNPKCKLGKEAKNRAKWANDILKKAKIVKKMPKMHTLVATTSQLGTDYNIPRSPISPEQLSEKININKKIGIIFGRESSGLTNKELALSDFVVTIPSHKKYPTLNLSHSVAVICYELSKKHRKAKIGERIKAAEKKDKEHLLKLINNKLKNMEFATPSKRKTQKTIWKRIIGKSFLTKREAFALMGFIKKIK